MDKEVLLTIYHKYKIIIYPVVAALAGLVLIYLVIYPELSQMLAQKKVYDETNRETLILEVKAQDLQNIDDGEMQKRINVATTFLPPDKDYTSVISVLQNVVASNGFSLVSLQIGQVPASPTNLNSFNIKIESSGSKVLLTKLLNDLESAPRVMKLSNIELVPQRDRDLVDVTISVDVYFAPVPNILGAVDAPLARLSDQDEELLAKLIRNVAAAGITQTTSSPTSLPPRGKSNPFE